jgi:hypothetical protein
VAGLMGLEIPVLARAAGVATTDLHKMLAGERAMPLEVFDRLRALLQWGRYVPGEAAPTRESATTSTLPAPLGPYEPVARGSDTYANGLQLVQIRTDRLHVGVQVRNLEVLERAAADLMRRAEAGVLAFEHVLLGGLPVRLVVKLNWQSQAASNPKQPRRYHYIFDIYGALTGAPVGRLCLCKKPWHCNRHRPKRGHHKPFTGKKCGKKVSCPNSHYDWIFPPKVVCTACDRIAASKFDALLEINGQGAALGVERTLIPSLLWSLRQGQALELARWDVAADFKLPFAHHVAWYDAQQDKGEEAVLFRHAKIYTAAGRHRNRRGEAPPAGLETTETKWMHASRTHGASVYDKEAAERAQAAKYGRWANDAYDGVTRVEVRHNSQVASTGTTQRAASASVRAFALATHVVDIRGAQLSPEDAFLVEVARVTGIIVGTGRNKKPSRRSLRRARDRAARSFFDHVRSVVLRSGAHWNTATDAARVLQDHVLGILRGIEAKADMTVAKAFEEGLPKLEAGLRELLGNGGANE